MRRNPTRTPKVFHANYQPARPFSWSAYKPVLPLIWLLIIAAGFLLVGRLPIFLIKTVGVTGASADTQARLQSLIGQSLFSSKISQLIDQLKQDSPVIDTLSCRRGIPDTLRCEVTVHQPVFLWQRQDKKYLVSSEGLLYAVASEPAALPLIEDRAAQVVELGAYVAGSEILAYYQKLYQLLLDQQFTVDRLFIDQSLYQVNALLKGSSNETITFPATGQISVLFAANRPAEDQIKTLMALMQQKGAAITERVDVRVGEYAYYK